MTPKFLQLADAMQLLTLLVIGPGIAIVIVYRAWRGRPQNFNPQQYGKVCLASGATAAVLLSLAKWIDADVRTPQYLLQLAFTLLGFLLLGIGMGCLVPVLLHTWWWHKTTQLSDHSQAKH